MVNALAQSNVVIGRRLNGNLCFSKLVSIVMPKMRTRTHIYGKLIKYFKDVEKSISWVKNAGLLPNTEVWIEWSQRIVDGDQMDAKQLYKAVVKSRMSVRPRDERTKHPNSVETKIE